MLVYQRVYKYNIHLIHGIKQNITVDHPMDSSDPDVPDSWIMPFTTGSKTDVTPMDHMFFLGFRW